MVELASLKRPTKGKGAPPPPARTENNLVKPASGQKVPLQLKISPELRREFKAYAVELPWKDGTPASAMQTEIAA